MYMMNGQSIESNRNGQHPDLIQYPREALITTAVNFLRNSKVRYNTLKQKQQFLQSKGLTAAEVQTAFDRAGIFTPDPNPNLTSSTVINMGIKASTQTQTHAQLALHDKELTTLGYFKNVLHSLAFLSGVAYMVYTLWRYLVKFLSGTKNKSVNEMLVDIDKKVDSSIAEIKGELAQIQLVLSREQNEHNSKFIAEMNQLKSDLDAIRGFLLNRKQFADSINIGPPSIPSWQLETSTDHHSHENRSESNDNEKPDDITSGSGSSETEVVTKHSDSSMEMVTF